MKSILYYLEPRTELNDKLFAMQHYALIYYLKLMALG